MVVEEYVGRSLSSYIDEPFKLRAYLSLQLLKMAKLFYENPTNFILYLTDPQADNFAVTDNTNLVRLVDLENLIIVDKEVLIKSEFFYILLNYEIKYTVNAMRLQIW